jgi:hypothetical protein
MRELVGRGTGLPGAIEQLWKAFHNCTLTTGTPMCGSLGGMNSRRVLAVRVHTWPQLPGSVPFSVKGKGDGLPHKCPRPTILTCLFSSSMVCWRSQGHRCRPSGDSTPMIPPPTFIENSTDPTSFTSVRSEADLIRYAPLSLQLPLQFIEETPVGALGDELLGDAFDHPGLLEAQGEKAHRVLGIILPPAIVGDLLYGL